jgi:hypothetical protein
VNKQLEHMVAFILKEAQEKASETLVKAREQFAREKVLSWIVCISSCCRGQSSRLLFFLLCGFFPGLPSSQSVLLLVQLMSRSGRGT